MPVESLGFRQRDDGVGVGREPRRGVADDAGALHEVVHAEGGGVARRARGGEHMAGAGEVVTHRLGGVVAEEDGPGVADAAGDPLRAVGQDLEVLRGPPVGDLDRLPHRRHHDHQTVALQRRPGDRGARRTVEPSSSAAGSASASTATG